jgi:hypothetical protein
MVSCAHIQTFLVSDLFVSFFSSFNLMGGRKRPGVKKAVTKGKEKRKK